MRAYPWLTSGWFRVLAGVAALLVGGYALLVPTSLLFLSIGSLDCLGPECTTAQGAALAAGLVGVVAGVITCVLLIVLIIRARTTLLIASLVGLMVLPVALLAQAWGLRALSDGRSRYGEALQLSFDIDRAMQEVLVEVTGSSALQQPGINGPQMAVTDCEYAGGPGFQASSSLDITPAAGIDGAARSALEATFRQSRERMIMIPADIELAQDWQEVGSDQRWTVTASCQPLPTTS